MIRPAAVLAAALFAAGCSQVATVRGPENFQRLAAPTPVAVQLGPRADADTFQATLNGRDITAHFHRGTDRLVLDDFVFEPLPGTAPHLLTLSADPALDRRGRARGPAFHHTLTFFPPALELRGNVGIGRSSHVQLATTGRSSVMITLPQPVTQPTTLTVSLQRLGPAEPGWTDTQPPQSPASIQWQSPGDTAQIIIKPGHRVGVFTLRGHHPGRSLLRVQAPGYVAATLPINVVESNTTASIDTQ